MNSYFKTLIISSFFILAPSNSIHAMQDQHAAALAKTKIQAEIDHYNRSFQSCTGSTRSSEETCQDIKWKLTAIKMPNWNPMFTLECSNKEIEKHFQPQ